jgi:murein DD-endopeptidase MepM/ murein hydrolase activator NlpD
MIIKLACYLAVGLLALGVCLGGFTVMSAAASQKVDKDPSEYDSPLFIEDFFPGGAYDGRLTYEYLDPQKLEEWLAEYIPGSPLRGTMVELDQVCAQNDMNPAAMLGIAGHESSWETDGNTGDFNPFGIMAGSNPKAFGSFKEAFEYLCTNCLTPNFTGLHFPGLKEISWKYVNYYYAQDPDNPGQNLQIEFPGQYSDTDWSELPPEVQDKYNESWLYEEWNGTWSTADKIYKFVFPPIEDAVLPPCVDGWYFPTSGDYQWDYEGVRWGDQRTGHLHAGCDIIAPKGNPAFAICDGTILSVGYDGGPGRSSGGGLMIRLQQKGSVAFFYYMHMNDATVSAGDEVVAGQVIGHVGNTGCPSCTAHIHFQYHPDGQGGNYESRRDRGVGPVDPEPLLHAIEGTVDRHNTGE